MYSTPGLTIASKLPVSRPSANQAAVSSGRFSASTPIFFHYWIAKTANVRNAIRVVSPIPLPRLHGGDGR